MDPTLQRLQKAADEFALLDLPRQYALSSSTVEQLCDRLVKQVEPLTSSPDAAVAQEMLSRIDAAKKALLDPVGRALALITAFHGPIEDQKSVPPGFNERFDQLAQNLRDGRSSGKSDQAEDAESELLADRQGHLEHISQLFSFPRGVPNPAVQMARDNQVIAELNAIRMIDGVLGPR